MEGQAFFRISENSPELKVLEIKTQAIICQSGGTEPYNNNELGDEWFN